MPRRANGSGSETTPHSLAVMPSQESTLADLLGKLARRAGTWGWLATYERTRRGEPVPRWHHHVMKLTAAKRSGELRQPEGVDDGDE